MAAGGVTMTNHGTHSISSGALKAAVEGITLVGKQSLSGGGIHIIPAGSGQVQVIEVAVE